MAPVVTAPGLLIDPTANVIALVESNAKSSADLREADIKFYDAQITHLKEMIALRAINAETLRNSDLDRLAKTREVDVLAGGASAAGLATAVQTLANTSDRNAENLRNLVTSTSQALAKQTSDQATVLSTQNDLAMKDVNLRIAELQKSSYQGSGKSSVQEPQNDRLILMVEALLKAKATDEGQTKGLSQGAALIMGGLTVLGILIGIAGTVFGLLR